MSKEVLKFIVLYIVIVAFVILGTIGRYPLLVTILTISIVTAIIVAKIKFLDDPKRFILYGFGWSLLCIGIFIVLLLLGVY